MTHTYSPQLGIFIVTCDLRSPGQDYQELYDAISQLSGALKFQQSSWIVRWLGDSIELRNWLWQFVDPNDQLMIAQIGHAAWFDSDLTTRMTANGYPTIAT